MVTARQVGLARTLMAGGYSMKQAAAWLDIVPSSELDLALWRYIGEPIQVIDPPKRPAPMF